MKLNCCFRYYLIIIILLSIAIPSCKSIKGVSIDKGGYLFENQTDGEKYFVKIDTVYGRCVGGKSYLVNKELVMCPERFEIEIFRRKARLMMQDTTFIVYKIKSKSSGVCGGWFLLDGMKDKKWFTLSQYEIGDYQDFKGRYKDEVFEVEKITDVSYANVKGFWSSMPDDTIDMGGIFKTGLINSLKKKDLSLDMDVYIPKDDTLSQRPLMMFIHGGAFFIGDKATVPYQKWCSHFASLGYVCVSINYRMGFRPNAQSIERTAYQAAQDAHAAMRYLVSKKDIYRINPDFLFVGGASAGSITAMNLAYMRNENRLKSSYSSLLQDDLGNLESSGNKIYNKFRIKAVANMWGAMYDLKVLENSKASIISFHGDEDMILPYGFGYPFNTIGDLQKVFFGQMYGSQCIHERAQELGIRSELHTFHGQGHSLHLDHNRQLNENFYTIQNEIVDFFYDELIPHPAYIIQDNNDSQLFMIDTTNVSFSDWNVVGGFSIEESLGEIRASWFDDEQVQELRVSGCYKNGAGFEDVFVIKNVKQNESNSHK